MTWTRNQHEDAVKKAERGDKLSDHEAAKLREAGQQAGARGNEARRALEENKKKRR